MIDPELGDTIVDLGMVRSIDVAAGHVVVDVALTVAACPLRSQIERDVRGQVEALDWVESMEIHIATMDATERASVMARAIARTELAQGMGSIAQAGITA